MESVKIVFEETTISFNKPLRRLSMADAVKEYAGIDIFTRSIEDLRAHWTGEPAQGHRKTPDSSGIPRLLL